MRGHRAAELLARPVRLHGIQLGTPTEALVDRQVDRVVGFEVLCGDGNRRFLPFSVVEILDDRIAVGSALVLVDERDLGFYRSHSRTLDDCGYPDPWIDDEGRVHETLTAA